MMKILQSLGTLILILPSSLLLAANPSLTTITATIPALVQISGLSDINLSPSSFASAVTGSSTACVYTNVINPLGSYYVTATSANALAGAFRVYSGAVYITYNAYWNTTSAATQSVSLTSGTKTAQQSNGNSSSLTCGGVANANFNVSFSSSQVTGAPPATYTDTITLLITPS